MPARHRSILLLALLLAASWSTAAHAAPAVLPLTGALRSAAGGPASDGAYILFVQLYDVPEGGQPVWTDTFKNVALQAGTFAVELGSAKVLESALFEAGKPLFVGVAVGNDPELPRVALRPVPYALHAQVAAAGSFAYAAAKSPGGAATGLDCTGCVNDGMLANGTISSAKVAFAYAGSSSKGGPADVALFANQAKLADKAAVADKALLASSADEASSLACSGCVALGHLGQAVHAAFLSTQGGSVQGDVAVTGALSVTGSLQLGTSVLQGGRFEAVDLTKAPCDVAHAGQVVLEAKTKRLHFCDGVEWLRLRSCTSQCKKPEEVACGQPVVNDCGDACQDKGTLCAAGAVCVNGGCIKDGSSAQVAALSCKDILAVKPGAATGSYWLDPLGAGAYQATCDMTTAGGGWVLIAADAQRHGASVSTSPALADGTFAEVRAVHKSGFIACSCSSADQNHPWQACNPSHGDVYSFELMNNGAYVLQQTNWSVLPAACPKPATAKGDITCKVGWTAKKGDKLAATWQEASQNVSTSDNCGTQVIDLWAR